MVSFLKDSLKYIVIVAGLLAGIWLTSCAAAPRVMPEPVVADYPVKTSTPDTVVAIDKPGVNPNPGSGSGNAPLPTASNTPTAAIVNKANHEPAPELPAQFIPDLMKPGVTPVDYLPNTCLYLENRWGPGKSAPGTIVVPIMFHSVVQPGRVINDTTSISMEYFEYFMDAAKNLGFSTITTQELVGFLEHNQAIPERSMILILDDRRPGVTELFMPYLEENDWTLTLGWIAADSTRDAVWETMTALADTGRLDVQSHGFNHLYIQDYLEPEQVEEELFKPIEVIEARFGTSPIAHVWPGGNFNAEAIALAGEAGYQIGFTAYSRGPILFNWVPLGEPEMAMEAPLMVLPRFWSTAAVQALEEAVNISEAAKAYARDSEQEEQAYYAYYCRPVGSE
jgi:peptidoglycan/xylan/chitin deacetylase (PgdA/CDA1 family)